MPDQTPLTAERCEAAYAAAGITARSLDGLGRVGGDRGTMAPSLSDPDCLALRTEKWAPQVVAELRRARFVVRHVAGNLFIVSEAPVRPLAPFRRITPWMGASWEAV